jgi:hypothetical protein
MLSEQVDAALLEAGTDLKVVANVAVGYNKIDVKAARASCIICTNTPDVLTESVADFTWAMILAITRRSPRANGSRRHEWKGWAFDYMLAPSCAASSSGWWPRPHRRGGRRQGVGVRRARGVYVAHREVAAECRAHVAGSAAEHLGHRVAARAAHA